MLIAGSVPRSDWKYSAILVHIVPHQSVVCLAIRIHARHHTRGMLGCMLFVHRAQYKATVAFFGTRRFTRFASWSRTWLWCRYWWILRTVFGHGKHIPWLWYERSSIHICSYEPFSWTLSLKLPQHSPFPIGIYRYHLHICLGCVCIHQFL